MKRWVLWLNQALAAAAGVALIAMMLLIVLDISLRLAGRPLPGTYEMVGWVAAVAIGLSLGYTQMHRGHVTIDLVTELLPPRLRAAIETVLLAAATALFAAAAWRLFAYAGELKEMGSVSETLRAPYYPWIQVVAVGCVSFTLALLVHLFEALTRLIAGPAASGEMPS